MPSMEPEGVWQRSRDPIVSNAYNLDRRGTLVNWILVAFIVDRFRPLKRSVGRSD